MLIALVSVSVIAAVAIGLLVWYRRAQNKLVQTLTTAHRVCAFCGLVVARFESNHGVIRCANCVVAQQR